MELYKTLMTKYDQEYSRRIVPCLCVVAMLFSEMLLAWWAASSPGLWSGARGSCCPPVVSQVITPVAVQPAQRLPDNFQEHLPQGRRGRQICLGTRGSKISGITVNVIQSGLPAWWNLGKIWTTWILDFQWEHNAFIIRERIYLK